MSYATNKATLITAIRTIPALAGDRTITNRTDDVEQGQCVISLLRFTRSQAAHITAMHYIMEIRYFVVAQELEEADQEIEAMINTIPAAVDLYCKNNRPAHGVITLTDGIIDYETVSSVGYLSLVWYADMLDKAQVYTGI